MNKKRISIGLVAIVVLISGCSNSNKDNKNFNQEETVAIYDDDYRALLPFTASDARIKQAAALNNSLVDAFAVGQGLMKLSKDHFSPKNYIYKENEFLTYDALDASDGSTGILGRTSESNLNGLNPADDMVFQSDKGEIKSPLLLLSVIEYDWYRSGELDGISLSLVMRNKVGETPNVSTINEEQFNTYAEDTGRKLVNYLRAAHPEIGNDLPIYVTLFNAGSNDLNLPGTYFKDAYFGSKSIGNYGDINEKWVFIPGEVAQQLDDETSTLFNLFKESMIRFFSDDISMMGRGHYFDDVIDELSIEINMFAKSSAEVNAAIQYINDKMSIFTSNSYKITLNISCDNKHVGSIERIKNSKSTNVIVHL